MTSVRIPLPSREEMLATSLPWEVHGLSRWTDRHGVAQREPVVTRFASEAEALAAATQPGAIVMPRTLGWLAEMVLAEDGVEVIYASQEALTAMDAAERHAKERYDAEIERDREMLQYARDED
jgi:hypothetical protein